MAWLTSHESLRIVQLPAASRNASALAIGILFAVWLMLEDGNNEDHSLV